MTWTIAIAFLKKYWPYLGYVLALIIYLLPHPCPSVPTTQAQGQIAATASHVETHIVYKYKQGQPCPDVELVNNSNTDNVVHQEQTQTASVGTSKDGGLWIGAEYSAVPLAVLEFQSGPYKISGGYGMNDAWKAGASYRVFSW